MIAEKVELEKARQWAAALRAGLIASAEYNTHLKKGARPFKPEDFVKTPVKRASPEEFARIMHEWATAHNEARQGANGK